MKAITIIQPWASLLALGIKRYETRSWRTAYRGRIAIHAAKGFPPYARAFAAECALRFDLPNVWPTGVVLATARLDHCLRSEMAVAHFSRGSVERDLGDFSPGRWAWELGGVQVLRQPETASGALGLWEWEAPTDLEALRPSEFMLELQAATPRGDS